MQRCSTVFLVRSIHMWLGFDLALPGGTVSHRSDLDAGYLLFIYLFFINALLIYLDVEFSLSSS